MDAISYSYADKQAKRIKKFIENPDSSSGIVTVPKVIGAGENVTIPTGRIAILPNVQVNGTLNVEGEVFIPAGTTLSKVVELTGNQSIDGIKTFIKSPIVPTPTTGTQVANKDYADGKISKTEVAYNVDTSSFIPNTLASGAIIERGSNANGEYIKYADGTLICFTRTTSALESLSVTYIPNLTSHVLNLTLPSAYIGNIQGFSGFAADNAYYGLLVKAYNGQCYYCTLASSVTSSFISIIWIGRWK